MAESFENFDNILRDWAKDNALSELTLRSVESFISSKAEFSDCFFIQSKYFRSYMSFAISLFVFLHTKITQSCIQHARSLFQSFLITFDLYIPTCTVIQSCIPI